MRARRNLGRAARPCSLRGSGRRRFAGYDIFQDRGDGWKVTMKYFQNVVDIVRDLMSAAGTEKIYKEGMRKDNDGFMDIEWCSAAVRSAARALSFVARGACTTTPCEPIAPLVSPRRC